jgi:hypothetical protein
LPFPETGSRALQHAFLFRFSRGFGSVGIFGLGRLHDLAGLPVRGGRKCSRSILWIGFSRFFGRNFFAAIFLPRFFCRDFSAAIFLPRFFCRDFFCRDFLILLN